MGIQAKLMLWLLSLVVVLAGLFGTYRYGRHVEGLTRDAQQLAAVKRAVADANRLAAADQAAALARAERDAARRIAAADQQGRVEQGIAAHPEYAACALGADDFGELLAAIEGKP